MNRLRKNSLALALAAGLLAAGLLAARAARRPATANIGVVKRADLVQRVTIPGTAAPNRKSVISAPYNGYIRQLFVKVGVPVKAGDPIVSVAQSLRGSSEEVYPLRAPFAGTVVQVLKTEGEYVDQSSGQGGNSLVRIDDLTRMFIEATAPELEVGKLRAGQEAMIKASAVLGRSYKGVIRHIALASKEQKEWERSRVEFPVTLEVTDADPQLKSGMSVVVDVVTNKLEKILTLRHEFIQKDGEQYFVVTESGEKRNISVGLQNEEIFEIRDGLKEGERIRQTDFLSILKEP